MSTTTAVSFITNQLPGLATLDEAESVRSLVTRWYNERERSAACQQLAQLLRELRLGTRQLNLDSQPTVLDVSALRIRSSAIDFRSILTSLTGDDLTEGGMSAQLLHATFRSDLNNAPLVTFNLIVPLAEVNSVLTIETIEPIRPIETV